MIDLNETVSEKRNFSTLTLLGPAIPIHTKPTDFSLLPPLGPAIPDTEIQ